MHDIRQNQERRVSADGESYSLREFLEFFGDADGSAQWSAASPQAPLQHEQPQTPTLADFNRSPSNASAIEARSVGAHNEEAVKAAMSQAQAVLHSCSQQSFEAMLDQSCEELLRSASNKSLVGSVSCKTLGEVSRDPAKPARAFEAMLDQSCADLLRSVSSKTPCKMQTAPLSAVSSKPTSARVAVPKLQLPTPESEPFKPLIRPSIISSIGSDDGTCTVESTPCHSIDQPLIGKTFGAMPHEASDKFWLGRPSVESCISHIRGRTSPSESLTRCPSSATSAAEMQEGEREMLRKFEEENIKLREALNVEKQRVLDLKLADQRRRSQWKHELQKIEAELADKRSLEARCTQLAAEVERLRAQRGPAGSQADPTSAASPANSARQRLQHVVSLFIMHVREPLSAIRDACTELVTDAACPECPIAIDAGAPDGEHVDRLMRVLEVLRCYDKARRSAKARSASMTSGELGLTERLSVRRSFEPMLPEPDRLSVSVSGVAAAGGRKVLQTLDDTVEDISDWFLGEYQRGLRGDGYNEVVPKDSS